LMLAVSAAMMPLAAIAQVAPDRAPRADATEPTYKYQAYAGFSYTSLNQVNQSRYGLIGGNVGVSRNFGRFFAVTAEGAFYSTPLENTNPGNPGNPSVDMVLFGPEVHGHVATRWSVFARALLGGEHTGGESMTPNVSFAGGAGLGVEFGLTPRWVIRASGDDIASSFSVTNNSSQLGYSAHMRRNSRAGLGIAYRF